MRAKELTVNEALRLVKSGDGPAISIYLGTDRSESDAQGGIRSSLYRLYRAADQFLSRTHDLRTRERFLMPLRRALSLLHIKPSKGGVAIYHNASSTRVVRLPTPVDDLAVASDSFHVKPLLRCAQLRRKYFILSLKKNRAELISVSADGSVPIAQFDYTQDGDGGSEIVQEQRRRPKSIMRLRRKRMMSDSMSAIDRQIQTNCLVDRSPLVLAGPDSLQNLFRENSTLHNLLGVSVRRQVDDLDQEAIVDLAGMVIEDHFHEIDRQAVTEFRRAHAVGLASTDLSKIAEAAAFGQIQSLLIAEDRHLWGRLNRETGHVDLLVRREDEPADDLLDDIAELTLGKGGRVTVLPSSQLPGGLPIMAILRWADGISVTGSPERSPAQANVAV